MTSCHGVSPTIGLPGISLCYYYPYALRHLLCPLTNLVLHVVKRLFFKDIITQNNLKGIKLKVILKTANTVENSSQRIEKMIGPSL